jgi:tryptophan synthase beta chain
MRLWNSLAPRAPSRSPETAHAIRAVIDEALAARETGREKTILFSYSAHGLLDLGAYDGYLNRRLIEA